MNSRSNQRNLTFGENSRNLRIFGRFFPLTFRIITRFSSNSYFHMRAPYFNDYQNQNKWSLPQFGDFLSTKNVRLSVCPSVCLSVCLSVLRLWTAILFESLLGHPIGSKLPGWIIILSFCKGFLMEVVLKLQERTYFFRCVCNKL